MEPWRARQHRQQRNQQYNPQHSNKKYGQQAAIQASAAAAAVAVTAAVAVKAAAAATAAMAVTGSCCYSSNGRNNSSCRYSSNGRYRQQPLPCGCCVAGCSAGMSREEMRLGIHCAGTWNSLDSLYDLEALGLKNSGRLLADILHQQHLDVACCARHAAVSCVFGCMAGVVGWVSVAGV